MLVSLVERIHLRLLNRLVDRTYYILGPLDRPGGHSDSREYVRKAATEELSREIRENCKKTIWLYFAIIILNVALLVGVLFVGDEANGVYKYSGALLSTAIFAFVISMQLYQTRIIFDFDREDKPAPSAVKYMLTSSMTNIVFTIWINTVNPGVAGIFLGVIFVAVIYTSTTMQLGNFITGRLHGKLTHEQMGDYLSYAKANFSYKARAKILNDQMEGDSFNLRQLIKLQDIAPEKQDMKIRRQAPRQ